MRLLILGPPGAGKGTQAQRLAARLGVPAVSTGDIFRANVADATPLGRVAGGYMDAGEYVPDQVTNAMVRDRLEQPDCDAGFILDGYPRTLLQIHELERFLHERRVHLDAAIELVVDQEDLVGRLLARAETQGRVDDTSEVIRRRQDLHTEQTAPLSAHYANRGLLSPVDGRGSIDQVSARLVAALTVLAS